MNRAVASEVDIAILGGGMSGLALACQLDQRNAQGGQPIRNGLVLEPRETYRRDKTWCFWRQQPGLFDNAISHSWSRWEVRSAGRRWVSSCAQIPYVRVDSGRYYALAAERLARSDTVSLSLNARAEGVLRDDDGLNVRSSAGNVRAHRVVDTRPQAITQGTLLQHFYGWEVETDKDVFDPTTVTLMDFSAAVTNGVHFFYVLPFSARSALIETTHFSLDLSTQEQYEAELGHYLRHRYGLSHWHTSRIEQGVLPMAKSYAQSTTGGDVDIAALGLHADTIKPSTGYCFPHAQDQAQRLVDWLLTPLGTKPPRPRGIVARWLDDVFVSFLEHQAGRAPEVFFNLFKRVPPKSLVHFLSDRATFADYLRVIRAMPKAVMLREAFRYVFKR
jgi:lycopene beta-cyclase